jgi:serine/threonine protein kinase
LSNQEEELALTLLAEWMALMPQNGDTFGDYVVRRPLTPVDPCLSSALFEVTPRQEYTREMGRARRVLKMLNPLFTTGQGTERFFREIDVLKYDPIRRHPAIVDVEGTPAQPGSNRYAYVMPYLKGPTLGTFAEHGRSSLTTSYLSGIPEKLARLMGRIDTDYVRAILSIGATLADVLAFLHELGVIHRDVKPSNVMVQPQGPVLIDFGSVSISSEVVTSLCNHRVPQQSGTYGFMAPEAFTGALPSPSFDTFGLGATLRLCLTGLNPYADRSLMRLSSEDAWRELEKRNAKGRVLRMAQVPGIPRKLYTLLESATAADPAARPTMTEFGDGLSLVLSSIR